MMKRIVVLFIAVCMIATIAIAQSTTPSTPTPSTTPQASAPQSSTPVTPPAKQFKGKHAGRRAALRDLDDPRVKDMVTKQRNERRACKGNPSGAGCSDLVARQKTERRALMMQLRKEGKM
jgi:hypothetical protein